MFAPGVGKGRKIRWLAGSAIALAALGLAVMPTPGATSPLHENDLERSREAIQRVASGAIECSADAEGAVRYIGPTDDDLLACLSEYGREGRSLIISSGGGDALKALEAADMLVRFELRLEIRGICASSCGNYLVPAASSVSVEPYSAILLHGGPEDSDAYVRAVQDQAEARQRHAYPDATDEAIAQGREIMRSVMRRILDEHTRFIRERGVSAEWYRLVDFGGPPAGFSANDFAVVDPAYAARHVPRTVQDQYWFPCSPADREALAELITGASLFYRPQVQTAQETSERETTGH